MLCSPCFVVAWCRRRDRPSPDVESDKRIGNGLGCAARQHFRPLVRPLGAHLLTAPLFVACTLNLLNEVLDGAVPYAVSQMGGNTFTYDCNGNMTQRKEGAATYDQAWDYENRLTGISGAATATVAYDGDGACVKATVNGVTTVYVGTYYEQSGSTVKKYYYAGGQRVAMRVLTASSDTLYYLHTDHLGSTSLTTCGNTSGCAGTPLGGGMPGTRQNYYPFGQIRTQGTNLLTDKGFTGQRLDDTGLIDLIGNRVSLGL